MKGGLELPNLLKGRDKSYSDEGSYPYNDFISPEYERILSDFRNGRKDKNLCCNICGSTNHESHNCDLSRNIDLKEFVEKTQNELEADCNFLRNEYLRDLSRDQYGLCNSEALNDSTWDNSCFCSNCSEQGHRWHECQYPPFGEIISTMDPVSFNYNDYKNKFRKPWNSANPQ